MTAGYVFTNIPLDIRRLAADRGLVGDVAYGHHNANRSVTTDSRKSDDYANNKPRSFPPDHL